MNKKLGLIILFIACVFLAFVIFGLTKKNTDNYQDQKINNLGKKFPEFTSEQLAFFIDASNNSSSPANACETRPDKTDCIRTIAYVKENYEICELLEADGEHDYKCLSQILIKKSKPMLEKCIPLEDDLYINCLNEALFLFRNSNQCQGLDDDFSKNICLNYFKYRDIYTKYKRTLCEGITDDKLKIYCRKNITSQPFNYNAQEPSSMNSTTTTSAGASNQTVDTDHDGYTDVEEISKGFNPCGEGKLPTDDELKIACAKYSQ